jgi:hypothetical protein
MWAHHLTIVSVSVPWKARGIESKNLYPGIFQYEQGNLEPQLSNKDSIGPVNVLSTVGYKFIQCLSMSK